VEGNPELFLQNFKLECNSNSDRDTLGHLLVEYREIFTNSDVDLGKKDILKHQIDTQGHPPIRQRAYRVPFSQKPAMRTHINNMLESGIIEPSMSPWASPVLLVAKKSTGQTRLVCDYRKLNNISKKVRISPTSHRRDPVAITF